MISQTIFQSLGLANNFPAYGYKRRERKGAKNAKDK
jgi:hypothetical protein